MEQIVAHRDVLAQIQSQGMIQLGAFEMQVHAGPCECASA